MTTSETQPPADFPTHVDLAPVADPTGQEPPPWSVPPPAKRRRKGLKPWQYILIGAAIPILLGVAGLGLLPLLLMQGGMPGGPIMEGEQEHVVTRSDLAQTVTVPGTIEPTQRLDLSFASEGEVTSVKVTVGESVSPGTILAEIDDTDLRGAVSDASAEVDAAWKDYQDARKSGSSAAISAMRSAHAMKAQALKDARAALDKATLASTISGVVAAVNVQPGARASGSGGGASGLPGQFSGMSGGESSADIVVISRTFQVKASVGGAERARLHKGQPATIRTSSSGTPMTGTVTSLGVVAEASQGERPGAATFPLVVTIEGEPAGVFAGLAATIDIQSGGGVAMLAIPRAALLEQRSPTTGVVLVKRGDNPEPVDVTLGSGGNADMVEVVSGLTEGDVVVVLGGFGGFGPGMTSGGSKAEPGAAAEPTR